MPASPIARANPSIPARTPDALADTDSVDAVCSIEFGQDALQTAFAELRIEAELFQRGSETTRSQADAGDDDATPPDTDD